MDIECRLEGELDEIQGVHRLRNQDLPNRVLWAGCQDDQTSADAYIGGSYNGAFTYYLCKHLRDTQAKISRNDLLKRVRASLRHDKYDQIPQLECDRATRDSLSLEAISGTQKKSAKKT